MWLLAEGLHWRAARSWLPRDPEEGPADGAPTVLVLGYPSRPSGLHPMQVWRTEIAVRSLDSGGRLLFSGGSRKSTRSEAQVMADYARRVHGIDDECVLVETAAVSTWENVALSLPVLETARTIKVASSPMHAARARAYLAEQRPDLARRLRRADDYRFGEQPLWKCATVVYDAGLYLQARLSQARARR